MPLISQVTFQTKTNRVVIDLSDGQSILVDGQLALEKNLQTGNEISDKELQSLAVLSILNILRQQSFNYLAIRPRSSNEIRQYLKGKIPKILNFYDNSSLIQFIKAESIIEELISDLECRNYLNDLDFSKWWINQRLSGKGKGKKAIYFELKTKGIEEDVIDAVLNDEKLISPTQTATLIDKSIEKIADSIKYKKLDKFKAKQVMIRRLLSRGFEYNEIISKIDEWLSH